MVVVVAVEVVINPRGLWVRSDVLTSHPGGSTRAVCGAGRITMDDFDHNTPYPGSPMVPRRRARLIRQAARLDCCVSGSEIGASSWGRG